MFEDVQCSKIYLVYLLSPSFLNDNLNRPLQFLLQHEPKAHYNKAIEMKTHESCNLIVTYWYLISKIPAIFEGRVLFICNIDNFLAKLQNKTIQSSEYCCNFEGSLPSTGSVYYWRSPVLSEDTTTALNWQPTLGRNFCSWMNFKMTKELKIIKWRFYPHYWELKMHKWKCVRKTLLLIQSSESVCCGEDVFSVGHCHVSVRAVGTR